MLKFYPERGDVLVCNYSGFQSPEMVKVRPVIVVSPRFRSRKDLCTVIPLSTTPPYPIEPYHMQVVFNPRLPAPYNADFHWVKTDMINTVSLQRLSPIRCGKLPDGKRKYYKERLSFEQMEALENKILISLGIK